MSEASDASLIARVLAEDDRGAFAALVNRHQSAVRGLLARLCNGDGATADDLAQDTFVRAYRGLAGFRGGARFSTWLHRVAYNVFLDHLARGRQQSTATMTMTRTMMTGGAGAGADAAPADSAVLRYDLERAMSLLRPAEAAALTLSYAHQLSHDEIAEILSCPVGTVKTHIARGKQRLREQLGAWEPRHGDVEPDGSTTADLPGGVS